MYPLFLESGSVGHTLFSLWALIAFLYFSDVMRVIDASQFEFEFSV